MKLFILAAVAALAGAAPLQASPLPAMSGGASSDAALIQVRDRGMSQDGMSGMRHGSKMRSMRGMNHGGM